MMIIMVRITMTMMRKPSEGLSFFCVYLMINDVGVLDNGWRNISNSEASCYNGILKKACEFRLNKPDMHSRDVLKALGCKISTQCHIQTTQNGTFKFVVVSFTPFHSITSLNSSVLFHASKEMQYLVKTHNVLRTKHKKLVHDCDGLINVHAND